MGQTESPSAVPPAATCSPIVTRSWRKRVSWKDARQSLTWAAINLGLALLMYCEMNFHPIAAYLDIHHSLLWYAELTLLVVFLVNVGTDVCRYVSTCLFSSSVEITQPQKLLLGVKDTDPGFQLSPVKPASPGSDQSLVFSSTAAAPSPYNMAGAPSPYSPSSSPWGSHGPVTPTNMGTSFSGSYSYGSPDGSFQAAPTYTALDRSTSSYHGYQGGSRSVSPPMSLSTSLPYSPGASIQSLDGSGLRSRLSLSSSFRSPSPTERMTDVHSLSQYLREQEEKDYRSSLSSPDLSFGSPSFWSYGRPSLDYSQILRKNQYQLASRSPQSHKSRADDTDNMGEEVWGPLGVTDDHLFLWIERLRKDAELSEIGNVIALGLLYPIYDTPVLILWRGFDTATLWLGQTVLVRLALEIDNINTALRKIGCEDTEIGEVGVSTLKQLALTKGGYVPTLNVMVPYLDFSSNQEYLVKRIKELGSDGCISEFCWSGGGSGGQYGKPWGEHLPTDARLVMHMLCTYLDSRLPTEIKYPDGKTFTSQHFMKTPDKPNLEKENLLIYQSSINPPHFQVVVKNTIHNLPKGRNNMFHAILYFLYQVRTKENGMLGRVNLGMSGVNILWIIDD